MHRSSDEYNADDMNGGDYSDEISELESRMLPDHKPSPNYASSRLEVFNDYTADWPEISKQRKAIAGYRCSDCRLLLAERWSDLLNTHHLNGDKADNHPGNLLVVCVDCHNRRHGFTYRAVLAKDREYLDALRVQQGLAAWKP